MVTNELYLFQWFPLVEEVSIIGRKDLTENKKTEITDKTIEVVILLHSFSTPYESISDLIHLAPNVIHKILQNEGKLDMEKIEFAEAVKSQKERVLNLL